MFRYRVDVFAALKAAGFNQTVIQRRGLISGADRVKIGHGVVVGINTLHRLCIMLQCQPGDLIEYVPDADSVRDFRARLHPDTPAPPPDASPPG